MFLGSSSYAYLLRLSIMLIYYAYLLRLSITLIYYAYLLLLSITLIYYAYLLRLSITLIYYAYLLRLSITLIYYAYLLFKKSKLKFRYVYLLVRYSIEHIINFFRILDVNLYRMRVGVTVLA